MQLTSEKRIASLCTLSSVLFFALFLSVCIFCLLSVFCIFSLCRRSRYEGDMSFLDAPDA